MATENQEEDFQQELLELFAAEAAEWLSQANKSLVQLKLKPKPEETSQCLDTIQTCITNLGGSAATVELPEVEQLAYSLLPVLESLRSLGGNLSPEQCQSLIDRVQKIASAIQQRGLAASIVESLADSPPSQSLYDKLCQLREDQSQTDPSSRHIVQKLIEVLQKIPKSDWSQDEGHATKFLRELEGQDEEFLKNIEEQFDQVFQAMTALRQSPESFEAGTLELESALMTLDILQTNAIHVKATNLALFFNGLQAFFNVISEKGVALVSKRIAAVESRLGAVVPMAQQWVEMGRMEREMIGKVLSS